MYNSQRISPNTVLIVIASGTNASILLKIPAGHFSNAYYQHRLYII